MNKIFVSLLHFTKQIDMAFASVSAIWASLETTNDRVQWFVSSIKIFDNLKKIDCKYAKSADRSRYKLVVNLFTERCKEDPMAFLEARFKVGLITEDQYKNELLIDKGVHSNKKLTSLIEIEIENKISKVVEISVNISTLESRIKAYRTAIDYFGISVDEFTSRRWEKTINVAKIQLFEAIKYSDRIKKDVDELTVI